MSEFAALTIKAFSVLMGTVWKCGSGCIPHEVIRDMVLFCPHAETFALNMKLFQLMEEYNVDPFLGLLALPVRMK